MKNNKSKPMRACLEFHKEIREIQSKRIQLGKDKLPVMVKPPRITLAMTRHELFKKIKEDIINAELK